MIVGAHIGVGAEAAMRAAIAGDPVEKVESAGEMRDRILATTIADATSYDGTSTYIAKLILSAFIADPALASVPAEGVYAYVNAYHYTKVADGLWDVLKPRLSAEDAEAVAGMTGFMWGWAVNAARRCVELGPVPNPAIVTIGGE